MEQRGVGTDGQLDRLLLRLQGKEEGDSSRLAWLHRQAQEGNEQGGRQREMLVSGWTIECK